MQPTFGPFTLGTFGESTPTPPDGVDPLSCPELFDDWSADPDALEAVLMKTINATPAEFAPTQRSALGQELVAHVVHCIV